MKPSMHKTITRLMEWRTGLLQAGRYEDLARQYIVPVPVYVGNDKVFSIASQRQLEDAFRQLHEQLQAQGFSGLTVGVRAVEMPRNARFRVWSDLWSNVPGQAPRLVGSTVNYLRETASGFRTEMLECVGQGMHGMVEGAA
jgi:hypothetical protein